MGMKSLWSPKGEKTLAYLREKRHLSDEVIRKFQIGYCPRDEDFSLAGRILMPLFDPSGKIVVFTTRDIEAPKEYQHWHEPFEKSEYLYGLDIAKKSILFNDRAILVEGQFDVTCLHSYGLPMTVGLLGTAISIIHVAMLSRYCSEFYLIMDDDRAGLECINRAKKLYKDYSLRLLGIHFIDVTLPDKLDPDDFVVKYGKNEMIDILLKRRDEVLNG